LPSDCDVRQGCNAPVVAVGEVTVALLEFVLIVLVGWIVVGFVLAVWVGQAIALGGEP
jgi:hypothetical protein